MRIILSFYNGVYCEQNRYRIPLFYEAFASGLKENGNQVLLYHSGVFKSGSFVDERILESFRQFNPDLIIAFNNYGPDWAQIFKCPICIYEVDSVLYYSNPSTIKKDPNYYTYFILQPESRDYLVNQYGVDSSRIHFTRNFTSIQSEKLEKRHEISFLGSRFHDGARGEDFPWLTFQKSRPSATSRKAYKDLLHGLLINPFITDDECDSYCRKHGIPPQSVPDLVMALSCAKRVKILSAVADLGLDLYGSDDWISSDGEDPDLILSFDREKLCTIDDNQRLYNESKVCININHVQAVNGFSWRVLDIMASDGCLVMESNREFSRLFSKLNVPIFNNGFEAREKCAYILNNPSLREEIVHCCNQEIEQNWRFNRVLDVLEDGTGTSLRNPNAESSQLTWVTSSDRQSGNQLLAKFKKSRKVRLSYYALMLIASQMLVCKRLGLDKKAIRGIKRWL